MTQKEFSAIAHTLPLQPGIYKYYDSSNKLLYVGKAKVLRKRISSYFTKNHPNNKTKELVNRIAKIEFTIVDDEQDSFLLENSLIKQFQPPFNINLKDDKTYPYIIIKNEPFPKVFFTRKKINDGSTYIGPYTSIERARELLAFIKQTVLLRTCTLQLTQKNIEKKKFKVCLEYHLGNCKGPCEGLQSVDDYNDGIQQLQGILKGNLQPVIQYYKAIMQQHIKQLEFEKAAIVKTKLEFLQDYKVKSTIVNNKINDVDVFSILEEGDTAYVNYLSVANGTIVQTKTIILNKKLDELAEDVLAFAIAQIRNTFNSITKEIIVPFKINYPSADTLITIPKAGDKKKLLDLSQKNVNYFIADLKRKKILQVEKKSTNEMVEILNQIKQDLYLSETPTHIECFDNSNFQGSYPVSAMVCFKDGLPSKKDYRKFNVKTVVGINDFATMSEVVYRRYKRVVEENLPMPQLIIIDGGKGQLSAAMESINKLKINGKTTVVGLAKNEEEIFFPTDSQSIKLAWDNEGLKLIRKIRDEVHRFGITFHRNQRSKGSFKNELEQIVGIGKNTIDELLKKYKSVKNIKALSQEILENDIGKFKAKILFIGMNKE